MTDGPARREEIPEAMKTETGAPTGREVGVEVRKNTEMALVTMMTIMMIMINIGARRKIGGTIINLLLTTTVIYLIFCIYINVVLFFNVNVKLFPLISQINGRLEFHPSSPGRADPALHPKPAVNQRTLHQTRGRRGY